MLRTPRHATGVVLLACLAVAGCSTQPTPDASSRPAGPAAAAAPGAPADKLADLARSDPAAALEQCDTAPDAVAGEIEAALGNGLTLDDVFVAEDGGLTYLGANVMRADGERESSADVWIDGPDGLAALSGSARDLSDLPDGRDLYAASAGDEPGQQVQACSTARILAD